MKNSNGTIGNQTRDLPVLAQCLNQVRHRVPLTKITSLTIYIRRKIIILTTAFQTKSQRWESTCEI